MITKCSVSGYSSIVPAPVLRCFVAHNCASARNLSFYKYACSRVWTHECAHVLDPCARVHLANGVNYWYLEGVSRGVTRWRSRCEITWNVRPLSSLPPTPSLSLFLSLYSGFPFSFCLRRITLFRLYTLTWTHYISFAGCRALREKVRDFSLLTISPGDH